MMLHEVMCVSILSTVEMVLLALVDVACLCSLEHAFINTTIAAHAADACSTAA
jgi:hypothetical protein